MKMGAVEICLSKAKEFLLVSHDVEVPFHASRDFYWIEDYRIWEETRKQMIDTAGACSSALKTLLGEIKISSDNEEFHVLAIEGFDYYARWQLEDRSIYLGVEQQDKELPFLLIIGMQKN